MVILCVWEEMGMGGCINVTGRPIFFCECVCVYLPLHVPPQMGAYHTIDLVLNQPFTLMKDNWDFITLDRLGV